MLVFSTVQWVFMACNNDWVDREIDSPFLYTGTFFYLLWQIISSPIKLFYPTSDGVTGFFIPKYQAEKRLLVSKAKIIIQYLAPQRSDDVKINWHLISQKITPHASDLISMPFCSAIISILRENEAFIIRKILFPKKHAEKQSEIGSSAQNYSGLLRLCTKIVWCSPFAMPWKGKKSMLVFPPFFYYTRKNIAPDETHYRKRFGCISFRVSREMAAQNIRDFHQNPSLPW